MKEQEEEQTATTFRYIGLVEAYHSAIQVDYMYQATGTEGECSNPGCEHDAVDPGAVHLSIATMCKDPEHPMHEAYMTMDAADALVLANRLQRAASLVLEFHEDLPEVEREAKRFENAGTPSQ